MATPGIVAEEGALPEGGTVLTNDGSTPTKEELFGGKSGLEQFGNELEKPNAAAKTGLDANGVPLDPKEKGRYEHWQSEAQKAQDEARALRTQLAERAKFDPLIDVVRTDKEALDFLTARINGTRVTPTKPLEMPQKPDGYYEAEAFTNPESVSFKYQREMDNFRDAKLQQQDKEIRGIYEARKRDEELEQQRVAQAEQQKKFANEAVAMGIPEADLPEFFGFVNDAKLPDLVEYYKFKKGGNPNAEDSTVRFKTPLNRSAGGDTRVPKDGNIGAELLLESRRM